MIPGSTKSEESDWAFDFRTSSRILDDSDSDSALNEDTRADSASAQDRGLQVPDDGIDLSRREEAVVYKPNPFSIAKINAANRAQNQKLRTQVQGRRNFSGSHTSRPSKLVSTKPVQTNILDGFKVQAQKASLRTNRAPESEPAASLAKRSQAEKASNAPVLTQQASHLVAKVAWAPILHSEYIPPTIRPQSVEGHLVLSSNSDDAHLLRRESPISNYDKNSERVFQKNALASPPVSRNLVPVNPSAQFPSQNFNLRQSRPGLSMSSPLRGSGSVPPTNFKGTRFSSPIVPKPRSDIPSPNPDQYRRTLFKPCFPPAGIEARIPSVRLVSNLPTRPTIKPEEMPRHLPESSVYHRIKAERAPSTPPHEFLKGRVDSPAGNPIHQHAFQSFPRSYQKRAVRDAYAFCARDPDEEWSTLPSRKRKKPNPKTFGMPLLTKPFTLPGLRPTDVEGKQEVKHAQSRRKVHLYVPPPLVPETPNSHDGKSGGHHSDLPKASGTNSPTHPSYAYTPFALVDGATETKSRTDEDVYPSPSRSRVSRPSLPQTLTQINESTDIRGSRRPTPVYRPPSPPTSDLPMPGEDTDIRIHIDPQHVRRRHRATKALFEKRKRDSFGYLSEVLELESCGVVFRDADADVQQQKLEIGIVRWAPPWIATDASFA